MAGARKQTNGKLDEAMAALVQSQATLGQSQAAFVAQMADFERETARLKQQSGDLNQLNAERFARIEAILLDHSRILQALPDAIRDKIGFKAP